MAYTFPPFEKRHVPLAADMMSNLLSMSDKEYVDDCGDKIKQGLSR